MDIDSLWENFGRVSDAIKAARTVLDALKPDEMPAQPFMAIVTQTADAQVQLAELRLSIDAMQRELQANADIDARKQNYVPVKTEVGALVYRLKPDADTGEPEHDVCPKCFEENRIRALQPTGTIYRECHTCESKYQYEERHFVW
ncbi:MAG: hypothetical protein F4060_06860 [Holophagales bacterium]|nr:hypothetical protein [Holophagales bacterium]MYG31801.1 hypothetical protein [Holophagales bacterium]MYI79643.1 hypothetical protein [Holophagales bacterium]